MFNVAGVLLVLARTHSAPLAGATAAAATLPGALSGPVLGAWLDVATRRRALIVADQLLSVVGLLAILALAGHAPDWTLPACAVVYSLTRPLSTGSFFSALAEIAGPELLDAASAIEASSLNISFMVGPAMAGLIAGAWSPTVAIEVQAIMTALVACLIAINPVFEARPSQRAESFGRALRDGLAVLRGNRVLRATALGSAFAGFGWGLMIVVFPFYASRTLHAGANAAGYLWAGVASGSVVGTFVGRRAPSLRRVGLSYAVLGISAFTWLLAHTLVLGIALVFLTGCLEGPAYSGTIALRQRHSPDALRAQVLTTVSSIALVVASAGTAVGGVVHALLPGVIMFAAINALAAISAVGRP